MQSKIFNRKISTTIKNAKLVEERRKQIFRAALKLIRKKGYHGTTLRDISKESGISLGNLYDYIRTKEDILYLVHEKAAQLITTSVSERGSGGSSPLKKLEALILKELGTIDRYQDLIMSIYQESHALSKPSLKTMLSSEEAHMDQFVEVLQEGMDAGIFKPGNPVMLANLIKIMVDCWVLRRWTLRGRVKLGEMRRGIIQMIEKGIVI
jgi:AcrR family transcriptional regulator